MQTLQTLKLTQTVRAAPADVFRAFTYSTMLRDWLCNAASVEARQGGHLFLHWSDGRSVTGSYTTYDPPESLSFTWLPAGETLPAQVTVTCRPAGDAADTVSVTVNFTPGDPGPAREADAVRMQSFWTEALENLASVLETGLDLRFLRRPRLGIIMEDKFTPETARKLGVPVDKGVHVMGTADGSGAQAAGLSKDDILVSLNGVPLLDPTSFPSALVGLKAGDRPLVEYYRGAEKHSVALELSTFPIQDIPETAGGLAARVREIHEQVLAALKAQVAGLSEEQAAVRPAEGEWSVKELVAHFIFMERDYQSWAAAMLYDRPVEDWLEMRPNQQPRIQAGLERFGSLAELLAELKLAMEETAAMIAAFPEAFVNNRKHLYRRAGGWVLEVTPSHYFEEHKEQFQAAIDHGKKV